MPEAKKMIEAVRDFILTCPLLKDGHVRVDYTGAEIGYSIDPLPVNPVIKTYVDGGSKRQYAFAFNTKERFTGDEREAIENSGFLTDFTEWIEAQNKEGNFPELNDSKKNISDIEVTNSGFLFGMEPDYASYQIQCRFLYTQEV